MSGSGADLVRSFLEGDAGAVHRVEGWVRIAASSYRRRLGDSWEDAVQEALVEVTETLRNDELRQPERLRAWVFRATSHTCLDRIRKATRWRWSDVEDASLHSGEPSPLGRLLEEGDVRRLLELVARTPERCRRLWNMILAGLGYREMSERTGSTEGALRVQVLRCRRRARALAEAEWAGENGEGGEGP